MLIALLASGFWAAANVYVQAAGRAEGEVRAMFWSQVLSAIVLVPIGLLAGNHLLGAPWPALLAAGLGSAGGYFGLVRAFKNGPLSVMTPIIASWAVPAWLIGVLVFGERPDGLHMLGAALAVLGAAGNGALAKGGEWVGSKAAAIGWAIAASLGFGLMTSAVPAMREQLGTFTTPTLVWVAQWALMAPFVARDPSMLRPPSAWGTVAAMGLLESAGFVAYTLSTSLAPLTVVSPPASLSAVMTVAFVGLAGRERVSVLRWVCVAVATAGTTLLSR